MGTRFEGDRTTENIYGIKEGNMYIPISDPTPIPANIIGKQVVGISEDGTSLILADEQPKERPTWDEYFMKVAETISLRSTCNRGKPGCVFVKDNQILATGYAGSPPGFPHCDEAGHLMEERTRFVEPGIVVYNTTLALPGYKFNELLVRFEMPKSQHCIRTIHAEANAIIQAARKGIALEGSTLYVLMTPCYRCAMEIIGVGIKRIVCKQKYHAGEESEILFDQAGIVIEFLNKDVQQYPSQK